jgi:hypothetical protein
VNIREEAEEKKRKGGKGGDDNKVKETDGDQRIGQMDEQRESIRRRRGGWRLRKTDCLPDGTEDARKKMGKGKGLGEGKEKDTP